MISLIYTRLYRHQKQTFEFSWNVTHHEKVLDNSIGKVLHIFLNDVYLGNIPEDIFNNPSVTRASAFILKGISKTKANVLQKKLEIRELVRIRKTQLTTLAKDVTSRLGKPSKSTILKYILIKNDDALATRVPLWSYNKKIVGHLDLLLFNPNINTINVSIFLQEGNYVRYIPVVAIYGDLLSELLKVDKEHVECIIFKTDAEWVFSLPDYEKIKSLLPSFSP